MIFTPIPNFNPVFESVTITSLTETRIPFIGVGGLLTDSANLAFDGNGLGIRTAPTAGRLLSMLMASDSTHAININGTTNNYSIPGTTGFDFVMNFQRGWNVGNGNEPSNVWNFNLDLFARHTNAALTFGRNKSVRALSATITDTSTWTHTSNTSATVFVTQNALSGIIASSAAFVGAGTTGRAYPSYRCLYGQGVYNGALTAGSVFQTVMFTGLELDIQNVPSSITGSAGLYSINTYGIRISRVLGNSLGASTAYGLRMESVSGADINWGFYQDVVAGENNAFGCNTRIGGVTAPTVALDVTGAILASTTIEAATGFKCGGVSAVADGTYTVGIGGTQNGTITVKGGIITAVQEAIA